MVDLNLLGGVEAGETQIAANDQVGADVTLVDESMALFKISNSLWSTCHQSVAAEDKEGTEIRFEAT